MMLRNIFTKSLRDTRTGTLVWGIGLALIVAVGASQYAQIITGTGADRAKLVTEVTKAFQAFSFLMGEITSLDSIGGFLTVRILIFIPVMLGLWAAIVAAGLIRGEEQQGSLDVLLSTPHSRASLFRQKVAALWVAIVVALLLLGIGMAVGILSAGEPLAVGEVGLTLLNIGAITGFWAALALLIGQFVLVRRTVSSITGGVLFGTFLLNNMLESLPSLQWLAWFLPFHYYTVSKPIVPGREMEWGAWLVLVALTVGLTLLAGKLFLRRDVGSTFHLFPSRARQVQAERGSTLLLGSVFGKSIRDLAWPTFFWALGLGLYAIMIVTSVNNALEPLREMVKNIGGVLATLIGNLSTPEAYVSVSVFTYLPVMIAVFAITQIEGWSSEEEEGRLEIPAAAPLPRWQLLTARYVAISLTLVAILVVLGGSLMLGAAIGNVTLDVERIWESAVGILPLGLVVAAFGLCVATWLKRPGGAMPITIGLVAVMFFLELFAPLLNLPGEVLNLSIFHLFGRPMAEGANWGGLLVLVVATLVLGAGSLVGLNRRDIAK